MRLLSLALALFAASCLLSLPISAEEPPGISLEQLFPGQRFDPAIPTQEEVIGRRPGVRPIDHGEMWRYMHALAEASPRATLSSYATTHEGRPMMLLAVSDPETIRDLDGFREAHAARLDPRTRPVAGDAAAPDAAALAGAKAVAWMAYSIHGDEISGSDAAAALAYGLVAGEGGVAEELRQRLVILIDPMENPDGRDRYLAMLRSFAHAKPTGDLEDLSHTAVWPWGRGNHYLFDLNRDWFSQVHPESTRSTVIASWNPQLMVDAHEMGSNDTYLFSPARHPFNPFLPKSHDRWGKTFGQEQAAALDRRGYGYYTREWNEEFFPGYGSSWASYRGAIGILYEMSGTEGQFVQRRDGTVRTFAEAVEHQLASSVGNLKTLSDHREALLADYVADRRRAIDAARRGDAVAAYFLPEGRHPDRTRALVGLLRRQGLEVGRVEGLPSGVRAASIEDGTPLTVDAAAPVWVVPVDQPAAPLVRVLLDPHIPMETEFLQEQREYIERGKGSRLYDTTAWSLPLLYGVEAGWSRSLPADTRRVVGDGATPAADAPRGTFLGAERPFGWFVDGRPDAVLSVAASLLQHDFIVQIADEPVTVGGREWTRGSLLVGRAGNPDDTAAQLRDLAETHGVDVVAVSTSLAEAGPDLGGSHFPALKAPRVGVWTGWPISPTSYGAMWLQLDRIGLRFNGLDVGRAGRVDLSRYNVLVFPDSFGGSGAYRAALDDGGVARLKRWVEGGGTAIGVGSGAEFLADEDLGLTAARLRREALAVYPPVVVGPDAVTAERGFRFRALGLRPPAKPDDDEKSDGSGDRDRRKAGKTKPGAADAEERSPYDVAPIIGPGARPFVEGVDLGTPVTAAPVALRDWMKPLLPAGRKEPNEQDIAAGDRRLRGFGPAGALVRVELDPEHWLNWGAGTEISALVRESDTLVADAPVDVPARFAGMETLHRGGLLWPEAAARLAQTAYATRERRGRGQVVLFLNEPEFRGWTLATRRLLLNAILLGPGLGTPTSSPW